MRDDLDFDPAAVPVQPAATVMIVADRPRLEVLLVKRNTRMVFAGGMWVFPGGAVDPGEADRFEPFCAGLDDAGASEILGVAEGGLSYWVAAIRENFEEAGLLLARRRDGSAVDHDGLDGERARLNRGETRFIDLVQDRELELDTSEVHYVAHWITPPGSPRRYSARFFVTRAPHGQSVQHDESETVSWAWTAPREALDRHARGEMTMMSPTVRMLESLAAFESAEQVLEAASAGLDDERVRVRYLPEGGHRLVLPGDPGYDEADPDRETGWVRLRRVGGAR